MLLVLFGNPGPNLGRQRGLGREPASAQALAVQEAELDLGQAPCTGV